MSEETLYCTCCNAHKPAEWFDGNEKSLDGKWKTCARCRNKWRIWKENNRKYLRVMRQQIREVTEKVCRCCNHGRGPAQPAYCFSKNKRNPDGLSDYCSKCQHRKNALRRLESREADGDSSDRQSATQYGALTPIEVAALLQSGSLKDQTPGHWIKKEDDGKPPCWREVRDYERAWKRIMAPQKPTEPPIASLETDSPPGGIVGTALLSPPDFDPCKAPTDRASALRQLEMFAALAG